MKTENLQTTPMQKTFKYSVYSAFGFVGVFLTGFIAWSFTCLGSACFEAAKTLV